MTPTTTPTNPLKNSWRVALLAGVVATASVLSGAALFTRAADDAADAAKAPDLTAEQKEFFEQKVRPLLSANCYKCHAADAQKVKGNLLLDSRDGCLKGGDTGPAVVPGDPDKSLLIKAITYKDPDLQMPPKGEKMSDADIATLTEWVKMGAPDPRGGSAAKLTGLNDKAKAHWAYKPVADKIDLPAVKNKAWCKNEVDYFILAKLEANGFTPSKPASKEALIRRATYDLTGLPPTPVEVRAFKRDDSPNAFEKVIDRLLASPHYGERWGRYWLDTARYADTTGNDQNGKDYRYAYAWTYRDWVVNAINEDMPYDKFLKNQLAADQLRDTLEHQENLAALGFLTVGRRFPNVNDTIDERIDTIGKGMMGLTLGCARCHDHKFDPIPTQDYYSLHGILSSTAEPGDLPVIKKADERLAAQFKQRSAEIEQKNKDVYFNTIAEKSTDFRKKVGDYLLAALYEQKQTKDAITKRGDLITKKSLDTNLLQHIKLREKNIVGPIIWLSGIPAEKWNEDAKQVLESIKAGGEAYNTKLNPRVVEAFKGATVDSVKDMAAVCNLYAKVFAPSDKEFAAFLDANRKANSPDAKLPKLDPATQQLVEYPIRIEPAYKLSTEHLRELAGGLGLGNNPTRVFYFGALNELELTNAGGDARAMVVVDHNPHDDPIFIKGDQNHHGDLAPREFLMILSPAERQPFTKGSGRLELAECIADKHNPLTARVMVNRTWYHHFGEGFVHTPDDLGVQSEPPTHPELLDFLSRKFMDEGWSLKKLHKAIMLSATYQQSSENNAAAAAKDPDNKLLSRQNLRRLDFEAIRDSLLVFSGNADLTVGGRPVNLTEEPYSFRRTIYGYIDRGNVPEMLQQFDFSDPNRANSRRTSTIVPQQALFFMNSPISADVARHLVTRPEFRSATSDAGRVQALYMELFGRDARQAEVELAAAFFNAHDPKKVTLFSKNNRLGPMNKKPEGEEDKMMAGDNRKTAIKNETGEYVDKSPLTLWEQYAQSLLFTNEIVYVN